jgi:hypothetical protein
MSKPRSTGASTEPPNEFMVTTPRLDKAFERTCPELYRLLWGKRYLLPQYRVADYEAQDRLNCQIYHWLLGALNGWIDFRDDVLVSQYINYALAFHYGRPTLYLERELGEALHRTELPPDLTTADIYFKWPQLRIILPLGLLTINREGSPRSLTHLDMSIVGFGEKQNLPDKVRAELEAFSEELPKEHQKEPVWSLFDLTTASNQPGFNLVTELNYSEDGRGPILYGYRTAWSDQKLGELGQQYSNLQTALVPDQSDEVLIEEALKLGLNLLLFLSAVPFEYDPNHYERPPRKEGKHLKAGLARAHFVGKEAYRRHRDEKETGDATGRLVVGHYRAGHWRRVVYGEGRSKRRLQWIEPYYAGGK